MELVKSLIFKIENSKMLDIDLEEIVSTGSVIPQMISENGLIDEPLTEIILCDSISGGADYSNGMPRSLSLERILADGTKFTARYTQVI